MDQKNSAAQAGSGLFSGGRRVESQEQLRTYLQIANAGTVFLFIGVLILLAGFIVWAVFGKIESSLPVTIVYENGQAIAYVTEEDRKQIQMGMEVRTGAGSGTVISVSETSDGKFNGALYPVYLLMHDEGQTQDNTGRIILFSISPIKYLIN